MTTGSRRAALEVPVRQVTACALDGDGHLYVTTSAEGDEGNPAAGALYLADVGVGAPAIAPFAG